MHRPDIDAREMPQRTVTQNRTSVNRTTRRHVSRLGFLTGVTPERRGHGKLYNRDCSKLELVAFDLPFEDFHGRLRIGRDRHDGEFPSQRQHGRQRRSHPNYAAIKGGRLVAWQKASRFLSDPFEGSALVRTEDDLNGGVERVGRRLSPEQGHSSSVVASNGHQAEVKSHRRGHGH